MMLKANGSVASIASSRSVKRFRSPRGEGLMMLISASVLWSLTGLAVKLAVLPPLSFVLWRSVGAAAATAVVMVIRGRTALPQRGLTSLATILNTLVATTVV